jgi:hypothetical protein
MKQFTHNSRRQFVALLLLLTSIPLVANDQDTSSDTGHAKRQFMELAVRDIDNEAKVAKEERDQLLKKGGAAPLFVQLPMIRPFVDWDFYYIDRDLRWAAPQGKNLPAVRVPRGFVSDLASVPAFFWAKYPPTGRYAYAAIVHDYLYWFQTTTREQADEIMSIAMRDAGTDEATISDFYRVLRLTGGLAWSRNQKARDNGEKRVLKSFPDDPLISWTVWKSKSDAFTN